MANYFTNAQNALLQQQIGAGQQLGSEEMGMQDQFGAQAGYMQQMAQQYGAGAANAYNTNGMGGQGYTPQEASSILGLDQSGQGLQGVSPLTPDQTQGFQFTPDQQSAITGNPNAVAQGVLANNDTLGAAMMNNSANVAQQAQLGGSAITGSINPSAFNLSPGYTQALQNSLGQESQTLNGASNNPNLGLSNQFTQNYQFTPQDQQNIVNLAGLTAGQQFQAQSDSAARQAAAQGNGSPLAIAALQQNLSRQGANAASQAMTNAQIQATNEALGVTQTAEQMRLGTAQDISSRQMQAGESLAGSQIGAANTQQQLALQGAQAGQGLNLQANTTAAGLGTQAAQYNAGLQNQAIQYATGANMQAGEYANTNAQQQAALLAQNQQATNMYGQQTGYTQGMGVNQALSQRYQQVANTQNQEQMQYAGAQQQNQQYYQGQTQNAMQGQAGMYNTMNTNYGQTYGMANQGLGQAYGMQQPSIWAKLGGAVTGVADAFASGLGKGMGAGT